MELRARENIPVRDTDYLLATARKLFDNNEVSLALNVYAAVLKKDPNNPEALRGVGLGMEKKGDFDRALKCYQKWAKLVPHSEPHTRMGALYLRQGHDEKAVASLEKALQLDTLNDEDRYELFNHLGNAYLRRNLVSKAESTYKSALALRPHSDRTRVNLGTLYFHTKDFDRAYHNYSEAFRLNPKNTKSLCGLGLIAQEKQQWEEALKYFSQALDRDWSDLIAVNGMIRSGQQLGTFNVIELYLKRYLTNHPSNVAILYCLAGNYFHQKKWRECREEIQKIEMLEPYHEPTNELKGLLEGAIKKTQGIARGQ